MCGASVKEDEFWMRRALAEAEQARALAEVPVGAVLVRSGAVVATGYNRPITAQDSTAHAEIVALRAACQVLQNYRLPDTTLYVTLEPCMMCLGALVHARIARLVYGAREPKAGAVHSHTLADSDWLNHRMQIEGGVLASECAALLTDFFAVRRAQRPRAPSDHLDPSTR